MNGSAWRPRARKLAGGMLPVLLASSHGHAGDLTKLAAGPLPVLAARDDGAMVGRDHLRPDDRLGDLIDHPAFRGFSYLLLPLNDRDVDRAMPLSEMGRLLPYHSNVMPGVVVAALNRMVDDAGLGRRLFYEIYADAERQAEPSLNDTGLFFLRGKPGAPFALIAPGGGFAYVGAVHEGFPFAEAISRQGFNAFVLRYRTGRGGRVATQDMAAAVDYILRNALTLRVDTRDYSVWGSSAGARMAAAIGSHGTAGFGLGPWPKPAVAVMAYTGHAEVTASEPPTFVVVGDRDRIAPPAVMAQRVAALRRLGTPVEFHRFPGAGHGFGTGQGTSAQGWIERAIAFWERETGRRAAPSALPR